MVSQLAPFLGGCVHFGSFSRIQYYTSLISDRPTPVEFIRTVKSVPEEAVILLSVVVESGETIVTGIFSPNPDLPIYLTQIREVILNSLLLLTEELRT